MSSYPPPSPPLSVARSLHLALMASVLPSVTVETKVVRHRDVTNCMTEKESVYMNVRGQPLIHADANAAQISRWFRALDAAI